MLATIDDETARRVDRDRLVHGAGYLRVRPDGRAEHVPAAEVRIVTGQPADGRSRGQR